MDKIQPSQVTAWVKRHFPDHKLRRGGEQIRINNPFVYDDDYHLEISTTKQFVNDFRGNSWIGINKTTGKRNKCTFLRFVQLYLTKINGTCSYRNAIADVAGAAAVFSILYKKPKEEETQQEIRHLDLPDGSELLDVDNPTVTQKVIINYLRQRRNLPNEKIVKYKMMATSMNIVWPYYEFDELVYWQSRSIVNKKFQFPPESVGVTKGQFLYGFDLVEPASDLIITEAIIDCQTLDEQCVATGGCNMTSQQVRKLRLLAPKDGIILAPDNDIAGINSIIYNSKMLAAFGRLSYSVPPRIEYNTEDGEKKYTKDWNDIAVYTNENPLELLHKRTEILGHKQMFDLMSMLPRS